MERRPDLRQVVLRLDQHQRAVVDHDTLSGSPRRAAGFDSLPSPPALRKSSRHRSSPARPASAPSRPACRFGELSTAATAPSAAAGGRVRAAVATGAGRRCRTVSAAGRRTSRILRRGPIHPARTPQREVPVRKAPTRVRSSANRRLARRLAAHRPSGSPHRRRCPSSRPRPRPPRRRRRQPHRARRLPRRRPPARSHRLDEGLLAAWGFVRDVCGAVRASSTTRPSSRSRAAPGLGCSARGGRGGGSRYYLPPARAVAAARRRRSRERFAAALGTLGATLGAAFATAASRRPSRPPSPAPTRAPYRGPSRAAIRRHRPSPRSPRSRPGRQTVTLALNGRAPVSRQDQHAHQRAAFVAARTAS